MAQIDLRNIQSEAQLSKEGDFNATIMTIEDKKAKSGNEMTVINFKTDCGGTGTIYMVWTEKMMGRNKGDLMKLGLNLDSDVFDTNMLVGKRFIVRSKYRMETQTDALGNVIGQAKSDYANFSIVDGLGQVANQTQVVNDAQTVVPEQTMAAQAPTQQVAQQTPAQQQAPVQPTIPGVQIPGVQ